ncbi:MAG: hypothetical protein MR633_03540 [Faecalibacterium prausnitzii]|nr:hypothetical protein [Faecalibacterium prausnitzii]
MNTIACPKCGKALTISYPSRAVVFCEYCGTKINFNVNVNLNYSKSEHTERIIDEAKIKNAENVNRVIGVFAAPFEAHQKAKEAEKRQEEAWEREQQEAEKLEEEKKRIRKEKIMSNQYSIKEGIIDFLQSRNGKVIILLVIWFTIAFGGLGYLQHKEDMRDHQAKLDSLKQEEIAATRLSMGQASIPDFSSDDDARTFAKNLKDHGFVNVTTEAVSGHKGKQYDIIEVVVDGAPDYSPDTWYPTDTDIVVRYCAETNQGNTVDQIFDRVNDFLS